MDTKVFALTDCKILNESKDSPHGGFEGYASVYGNVDRVNEIVNPGSISNLDEFIKTGVILNGHDKSSLPIGTIKSATSDEYGLKIAVDYHSTQAAQDARTVAGERLARGKSVGLSIGYSVNDAEDLKDGTRLLKDLTLYEVSQVTIPANPLANVTAAKTLPLASKDLDEHVQEVLEHCDGLVDRLKALADLRAKDNRTLSATRRDELTELHEKISSILALSTPPEPKVSSDLARALAVSILNP